MIVNVIDHEMSFGDTAMHRECTTNGIRISYCWNVATAPDTIQLLKSRGHKVFLKGSIYTSLQTVSFEDAWFRGGADPRRENSAAVAPAEINAFGN